MRFLDTSKLVTLFTFTNDKKILVDSSKYAFEVSLQKSATSGSKGFLTHKRGIKNKSWVMHVEFKGTSKNTNVQSFATLVENQTTVYFDASGNADFARFEGYYDFDGNYNEEPIARLNVTRVTVNLFENKEY